MPRKIRSAFTAVLGAAAFVIMAGTGAAQTITFNNLTGNDTDLFFSYTEAGFNVNLIGGDICKDINHFGNPVPDLFGGPSCSRNNNMSLLSITRTGGGLFRFLGADLTSENFPSSFTYTGLVNGAVQYTTTGSIAAADHFTFYPGLNPTTNVDELRIQLHTVGDARSYNIDNIQLAAAGLSTVPEPASFLLLGAGLFAVAAARRRRQAA